MRFWTCIAVAVALAAAGAAASVGRSGEAAQAAPVASQLVMPLKPGWLRQCRASGARLACPTLVQRTKLWADPESVRLARVVESLGVTSYLVYADARYKSGEPVCALLFDGVTRDYSRLTPACYARFAPGQGLVVWASLSVGPILSTVHVEWKTRRLQRAQLRNGVAAHHGAIPLDFGSVTWNGRRGRLLLGPRGISEELVFVWRHGSDEVGVGIQVFEPLTTAVATLRAMVASVPRG